MTAKQLRGFLIRCSTACSSSREFENPHSPSNGSDWTVSDVRRRSKPENWQFQCVLPVNKVENLDVTAYHGWAGEWHSFISQESSRQKPGLLCNPVKKPIGDAI